MDSIPLKVKGRLLVNCHKTSTKIYEACVVVTHFIVNFVSENYPGSVCFKGTHTVCCLPVFVFTWQIVLDNRAHSGKVKIHLENQAKIKECKDPSVSGQGEDLIVSKDKIVKPVKPGSGC